MLSEQCMFFQNGSASIKQWKIKNVFSNREKLKIKQNTNEKGFKCFDEKKDVMLGLWNQPTKTNLRKLKPSKPKFFVLNSELYPMEFG